MLLGGFIAFFGDRIGKYVGKRKLTIFHLRPRHTSQLFTVLFGMLISLVTLSILTGISYDARQTLFHVRDLTVKRKKLEKEITQLTQLTTLNEVIFHVNQPIVLGTFRGGQSLSALEAGLSKLLAGANQVALERSEEARKLVSPRSIPPPNHLLLYQKEDFNRTARILSKTSKNFVVMIYSLRNTYLNEQILVQFDVRENKKIYLAGKKILSVEINGKESKNQILVDLFSLFSKLQQTVLDAGMIPNPVTNDFGGNVLVATLFDERDRIKQIGGPARVDVVARKNLWTSGPLDVSFLVSAALP